MSGSCTLGAYVRNSNGEVVESKLFNDLLHYTSNNREITKEYYKVGTDEEFLSKVKDREDFETDENGEITFKSLNNIIKIDLATDKLIDTLNKDIHSGKYSYEDAKQKVQFFNENNVFADKVLATMTPLGKNEYFVSIVPTIKNTINNKDKEEKEGVNTNERKELYNTVRNKEMEKRILDILSRHKVSVKFIEGESEGGRYSTENITNAENGLYGLIEVVEKGHTTDALAEEAGHFAVGALGDYPLVRRLERLLSEESARREALGEEYEKASLGINPAREVAGRLVGKAIQRKLSNNSTLAVLANRIVSLAKRVFYNFTGNEVRWAAAKAEQVANKIAYKFVEGSNSFSINNAINIKETMHNASLTINTRTYRNIVDEMGRLTKRLEAIAEDSLAKEVGASLLMTTVAGSDSKGKSAMQYANDHVEVLADSLAFDGIVQALVQITDYLGGGAQIDRLMQAVDLNNPSEFYSNLARNGRYLRQARTMLRSAEVIVDTISQALNTNNIDGVLKSNGVTLEDGRYQDEKGVWHSYDIKKNITAFKALIGSKKSNLTTLEQSYFARFCEDVYGKKYISHATGILWKDIWNGVDGKKEEEIQYIADLVKGEGVDDIDLYHRYLGAMANNPDVIGQIVDKLVKLANKNADDLTIKTQNKLLILKDRAEKLGLDMEDLLEKDENGVFTGNIITPPAAPTEFHNREEDFICQAYLKDLDTENLNDIYAVDHGKWERARAEFKKQAWEDFKKDYPDWQSMSGLTRGLKWKEYLSLPKHSYKEWNKANSIKVVVKNEDGSTKYVKWVPNAIYKTDAWENLKKKYPAKGVGSDSLTEWVHDYMELKQQLDSTLPEGATTSYRLPQFRGTFGNSVRNKMTSETGSFKKTKAWSKIFGRRVILESFMESAEETDFGDMTTMNSPDEELLGTKLDYEEERAARLPIFGVNKIKNMEDFNTDILSSTLAYASMAHSYLVLSSIVDSLEVGREALYNRTFTESKKDSKKKGLQTPSTSTPYEVLEKGSKNRAYGRYIKFLNNQVYGIKAPYYGLTVKEGKRILLSKVMQNINSLGGTLFLKGNVLGGTVNTITGFNNIAKEVCVGEHFTLNDFKWANKYYYSNFVNMWAPGCIPGGDLGNLVKQNKLDMFLVQMNASSNNREKFRNWYTKRSRLNNFYRMLGYMPYTSGDHWMQAMSYLMIAHGTKLYNENGSEACNLWDAWQKTTNTDDKGHAKGYALNFERMCPINAGEITTENLNTKGFYLKRNKKTKDDFHNWLYNIDSQFADKGYVSQHIYDYEEYKKQFNALSSNELMDFQKNRISTLRGILEKVENYLYASGPFAITPQFTQEEQNYLSINNLGTGNYQDIRTKVRDAIFNMIWTKVDESNYMDKCREINSRLHGITSEQDKTSFHTNIYTNAFLSMKNWALGYIEYMFSPNHTSLTLGKDVEGFANTGLKVPVSALLGALNHTSNHMGLLDVAITMLNPWSKRSKNAMLKAGFTEEQHFNARRMACAVYIMLLLSALVLATAPPDDKEDEEEDGLFRGNVFYLAFRAFLEQAAFMLPSELYKQTGSLMDFVPVGVAALMDLYKLAGEGVGAIFGNKDDKTYFYQKDSPDERYEEGDSHFKIHLLRLIPYVKSWWAINHPDEAKENYDFGRKLRSR